MRGFLRNEGLQAPDLHPCVSEVHKIKLAFESLKHFPTLITNLLFFSSETPHEKSLATPVGLLPLP